MSIFTVSSIDEDSFTNPTSRHKSRCWGWYLSLKKAKEAVAVNTGDMAEGCYYTHCLIEEISEGIPVIPMRECWYKWIPEKNNQYRGRWKRCKKPKWTSRVKGWSFN
jgi:hypothetical protein